MLKGAPAGQSVVLGPSYGEDAAAVRLTRDTLIAASDPITFATDQIGWYAVTVNANDIAAGGATPKYFLATILLPKGSDVSAASEIFSQICDTCTKLDISLIGGHTEVTDAVSRPVICGTMFGETDADSLVATAGAQTGDDVLLAGEIAVEGTALLALDAQEKLESSGVAPETIQRAKTFLQDPGICIIEHARLALESGGVHAMHDPTEGGLASALAELAGAAGCGVIVERGSIPILPECTAICSALGLDPLGLIASGSLLITCAPESSQNIIDKLHGQNIPCAKIGKITLGSGVAFSDAREMPKFERDEIARFFEENLTDE